MTRELLFFGSGGHARVIRDIAIESGYKLSGFVLNSHNYKVDHGEIPVFTEEEVFCNFQSSKFNVVIAIGDNEIRQSVGEKCLNLGFQFCKPLISSGAFVASNVNIGFGTVIMPGVVINSNTSIGSNTIINTRSGIDHDCTISDFVHVGPGVTLAGGVTVGEGTFIGAGSTIIPGVSIGKRAIVAAGSVVINDVKDSQKVAGVPAKPMVKK